MENDGLEIHSVDSVEVVCLIACLLPMTATRSWCSGRQSHETQSATGDDYVYGHFPM